MSHKEVTRYAAIYVPTLGHTSIFSLWIQMKIKHEDRILKRRKFSLYTSLKPTSLVLEITIYSHSFNKVLAS
jgi:hypothetical protein